MLKLSVSQLWGTGPEWLGIGPPLSADVESLSMPEPCSQEFKSTCKLSHNLLTIEEKATIGDLVMILVTFKDSSVTAYVLRG